jgi:hypothetical protein
LPASVGLIIVRIQQILSEVDGVYKLHLEFFVRKIQVTISRKIKPFGSHCRVSREPKLTAKVMDNTGRSVWSLIVPISTFPEFSPSCFCHTHLPLSAFIIIPCIILALPNIMIGVNASKEWHALSTEFSPKWRVWSALEDFAIKGRYLYENKILDHVDILLKRRIKMANENFSRRRAISTKYAKKRQTAQLPMALFQTGTRLYLYYLAIIRCSPWVLPRSPVLLSKRFIGNISRLIRQAMRFQNYLYYRYQNLWLF